jgi:outer membrane receptor protein involved in Fe transport
MAEAFAEEILVSSESPVVDVTSTAMSTRIDEQLLANLPVGRDFTSAAFLAAGAVDGGGVTDDYLAGNPSIMGSSALENRYVVDRLDTTDPAYGKAGSRVSTSFIEEIQVKTAGYEAEYGGALGGVVNMMTRSGGNEFHGDVFGYFTNDSLWEEALVPSTRGEAKTTDMEWDVGSTLGGRLIRDKLWFFVGYNPSIQDQRVQNDLVTIDGEFYRTNDFVRSYHRDYLIAKLSSSGATTGTT